MDGSTRSNASSASPPCAVGSVSGPTVSSSSTTEPGHPCVMISGSACSCGDFTWMKWMSTASISVVNCGSAFKPCFALAPVVRGRPVAGELLHRGELDALRAILDELLARPPCGRDAPAEVVDLLVRDVDAEGADMRGCVDCSRHDFLLLLTQRAECGPHLGREQFGLLPGGEV